MAAIPRIAAGHHLSGIMDNVTHALAGALLAAGTASVVARRRGLRYAGGDADGRERVFRRVAFAAGVAAAELPDADLLYAGSVLGMGKLGYMLHHRGHTHTVVFALAAALGLWWVSWWALRRARLRGGERAVDALERNALLVLATLGTLSHLALDYTNSYGVHPWWPLDNRWLYGDAVFIVEPWLWIVAIPPLMFAARSTGWRVVLALLLLAIVGAAWRVAMVGQTMAAVLTAGTALWTALIRLAPAARRITFALVAWLAVEGAFFASAGRARAIVRASVGAAYVDAVLTPHVSNPFCVRAIVVERRDGVRYTVARATVAPFAATVPVARCAETAAADPATADPATADPVTADPAAAGSRRDVSAANANAIRWSGAWVGDVRELQELSRRSCEVAAALTFIRVPVWERRADGSVSIADARYGEGGRGFAVLETRHDAPCPRFVPPWTPPRADLVPHTRRWSGGPVE